MKTTFNETTAQVVPLQSLKAGESAIIVEMLGDDCTVKCLEERGFRTGMRIKVIVPGLSAVCQVGDHRLSLRICGHCEVFVRVEG